MLHFSTSVCKFLYHLCFIRALQKIWSFLREWNFYKTSVTWPGFGVRVDRGNAMTEIPSGVQGRAPVGHWGSALDPSGGCEEPDTRAAADK